MCTCIITDFIEGKQAIWMQLKCLSITIGSSLEDRKEPFEEAEIGSIIAQVCLALNHCHKNLVIHRDLKPANIMLDREGNAILVDFGVGTQVNETEAAASRQGSLPYMAPEVAAYEDSGSKRDLWSLGAIIYKLCAHEPLI